MSGLWSWFQAEYWPAHGPWYDGAIWGNVFVAPVAGAIGVVLWPRIRRGAHALLDGKVGPLHERLEEVQRRIDHVIEHATEIPPLPPKL